MTIKQAFLLSLIFIHFAFQSKSQQVINLYSDTIPNNIGVLLDSPTITVFRPAAEKATKVGLIIFPGGGYSAVMTSTEGTPTANAFAEKGVTCFVVKYRLPGDETMRDKSFGPLMDAQAAIKFVRDHANDYNIDINKIGVIGFSAGGHVASTLGTHFSTSYIPNKENTNLRPDFMVLVYPVISMDNAIAHRGSRINLLGQYPSMDKVLSFCSEEQVTKNTPPTYLTHTGDDQVVDVQNSIEMYQALLKKNVAAELHIYPKGNHTFTQRLPVYEWVDPIILFLKKQKIYTN